MPSSFNNKQSFGEKMKDEKIRRSYILTAVALCLALVIIAVTAVIANRSKDKLPETEETEKSTVKLDETSKKTDSTDTEGTTDTQKATQKPSGGSSNVSSGLPSFSLPVSGTLTSKHDPELQVFSSTMQDYRVHLGIDIQTAENAPVYAAADGTVSKIWVDTLMGYCIAIEHSGDCLTVYKNLAATLPEGIAEGVSVRSGQLIATVGNSAMVEVADEPHLHLEMTVADLAVDPLEYFDEDALKTITKD